MKRNKFFRLYFSNQDVSISLKTNSPFIFQTLRDSSKYFKIKRDNTKKKIKFQFILNEAIANLSKEGNLYREYIHNSVYTHNRFLTKYKILDSTVKKNIVRGWVKTPHDDPLEILELLYFRPLTYLLEQNNIFQIHAAALAFKNKGFLIAGQRHCGKSMLCLKLLFHEFKLLCEEDAFLRRKGSTVEVLNFNYDKIRIILKNLKFFKCNSLPGKILLPPYNKFSIDANRIGKTILNSKTDALFFPQYMRCKHAYIRPISIHSVINICA